MVTDIVVSKTPLALTRAVFDVSTTSISLGDCRVTLVGSFINCVAFIAVQKDRKAIPRGLSVNTSQFKSPVNMTQSQDTCLSVHITILLNFSNHFVLNCL